MSKSCSLPCFVLLVATGLCAQFATHVDYATGQGPFGVAAGDFNNDGKIDLAVANTADNTVSILLGNGDGTFQSRVNYATGSRPTSVIIGDFNGDGKVDLAVTNGNDNTVSILLGKGNGTFLPHVDYGVGTNPQWLVAADFNGDQRLDLAIANYGPNYSGGSVSVLLGNGDGTFQPQMSFSAGVNPFGVVAGDFNHDGNIDLAVVDNNGSWGVFILLGHGDGTFQSPRWFAAGANPRVGVAADFNGDGNLDLAIVNCIDNDISILFGDGAGNFSGPIDYSTGAYVQGVAGGDFNGDGKLDLANVSSGSNSVSVLLGNGDGTFQTRVDYAVGLSPLWLAVADFNGDGAPDLAVTNNGSNSVSILVNTSRATTTALAGQPNPASPSRSVIYSATVASLDGKPVTGSVEFKDGGVVVATVPLSNQLAAWSTKYATAGVHSIAAMYTGDGNNASSTSSAFAEYVVGTSKTVVTTSGSLSFVGQPVTLTATVTSKYGAIPDGDIVTFDDGKSVLASVPLSGGKAIYTTSSLTAKTHAIKATYAGDAIFTLSYSSITQVVERYSTTTTLQSSPNPSSHLQVVTFTARVTSAGPIAPTGRIAFNDGSTRLGVGTLQNGTATFTTGKLAVGTHPITAQYLSDSYNDKSTSLVVNQVVQ